MTSPEEVRLFTISSEVPEAVSLHKTSFADSQEQDVQTEYGPIKVAIQGNTKKPAIVTYHDIGLNHVTCFQGFFHYSDMQAILEHFCVYHINAPGQDDGALPLIQGYTYPTADQLADTVNSVVSFFGLKLIIGFGVGAGANILARYALKYPSKVEGLTLINPDASQCGWVEWGYQKFNSWYLKSGNLTHFTEDYLLWHWFGRATKDSNSDLVHVYKQYIKTINPVNLAMFIDSYSGRTDLKIQRPANAQSTVQTLKCNCMLVVGDHGPTVDETVNMNNRMDPTNTTLLKLQDCGGMVLEEAPAKLAESFRLFLQGLSYIPFLSQAKLVEARMKNTAIPTDTPPSLSEGGESSGTLEPAIC
ncbi:protein NDRG1-like isoform X2 [Watersipora subatra]|uniref:protein NDRG1-like isoform X2 n=1 Tax=Watersipora subatra TaxID=2589382 RepID=UPI00355B45F8